jgi:hypothetical protein
MGIEPVVFRPGDDDVMDELLAAYPRRTPQVTMTEGPDQQLRVVQPRRVQRREPGAPPRPATRPVSRRLTGGLTGVVVLDQGHPRRSAMAAAEVVQLLDVVRVVLARECGQFHPTGLHDQEQQQVDRPVCGWTRTPVARSSRASRAGSPSAPGPESWGPRPPRRSGCPRRAVRSCRLGRGLASPGSMQGPSATPTLRSRRPLGSL